MLLTRFNRVSPEFGAFTRILLVAILGLAGTFAAHAASTLTVTPATASVPLDKTLALTASLNGVQTTSVTWRIVPHGTSTVGLGTVTAAGLFTAPTGVPVNAVVQVEATSTAIPTLHAFATLTLYVPIPVVTYTDPVVLPIGLSLVGVHGKNFIQNSLIVLNGKAIATDFDSTGVLYSVVNITTPGTYTIQVVTHPGSQTSNTYRVKTAAANVPSYTAAVRFLEQSTFGPTPALIAHVQQVGFQAFLNEQFALKTTNWHVMVANNKKLPVPPQFYANAVEGQDQLRQRVALALSEMMVTSGVKLSYPEEVTAWQNLLLSDAFVTYKRLLLDVTLSPAMGDYLDMANNAKADPVAGTSPDENYAREVMQLFSIGLNKLNLDGTPKVDGSGNPIPNYNQDIIEGFSAAFTGWTYAPTIGKPAQFWAPMNPFPPMVPIEAYHDTNQKVLLNGTILPAGQTAQEDLTQALAVIANDPSVGPFVCKQLIQHLVTSNPSPAYVARVATVFNNNGIYVRGDLKAVVTAILLDPEARAGDNAPAAPGFGHQREPALLMAATMRAANGWVIPTDPTMWWWGSNMGQDITDSPDVFDYFPIGWQVPATGQVAPEMGIYSSTAAITRANWVAALVFGPDKMGGDVYSFAPWTSITNDNLLIDKLNVFFLHGQMSSGLRAAIKTALSDFPGNQKLRAQQALYTVLISPEYQVEQ